MALGDNFLKLTGKRAGKVKGEAKDAERAGEIDVLGWSWAMDFPTDLRSGGRTGRATLRALVITKACDSATTPVMSMANTNDEITEAVLTVRKAGGSAVDYLKITITGGGISNYKIEWHDLPVPQPIETFEMRFKTIEVNYSPQAQSGSKSGNTSFSGQVTDSA